VLDNGGNIVGAINSADALDYATSHRPMLSTALLKQARLVDTIRLNDDGADVLRGWQDSANVDPQRLAL